MAQRSFQFRVSFHTLLIGLLLTVIPLSLVGLYSITQSERSLERTIGAYFKSIANATAADVAQYIGDRVITVAEISMEPTLVEAAKNANRAYQGQSEEAITKRIAAIEKTWETPAAEPTVQAILGSAASKLLRRHRTLDQRFLRITVTDERGATIAGTHKSVDYYQGDEEYWQDIVAGGARRGERDGHSVRQRDALLLRRRGRADPGGGFAAGDRYGGRVDGRVGAGDAGEPA